MNNKSEHLAYIKKTGRFIIDCNTDAFSNEEIKILVKWGNWFQALCDETLTPYSMRQEQFIQVYKGEYAPVSIEEKAWSKYLGQKRNEERPGDPKNKEYLPHENPFYTDEMYKQQKKMMGSVIWKNHRS